MFVSKLQKGSILMPRISNSEIYYDYEPINYIGVIHLSQNKMVDS